MFKVEKNNEKIGAYLADLIDQKYPSRRNFCKEYIKANGEEPTSESINNMSNRLAQIIKGKKALQTYDLPFFTALLGVSCEQILSAGECCVPLTSRVTNYSVACSKDPDEWKAYIDRADKLVLNCDEYCKTVLDYALEFGNYDFIKFLMDSKYIWFDSRKDQDYIQTFGAGTSIKRREIGCVDYGLEGKLMSEDSLRLNLISLAVDNNDIQMLNRLRARENPQLYFRTHYLSPYNAPDFDSCYDERMIKHIAASNETILDYFTNPFEISDHVKYKDGSKRTHAFLFPYISDLLDHLIANRSPFAETALKKAIGYNKQTCKKLCELIRSVKDSDYYQSSEYFRSLWVKDCKENLHFFENGNIVMFLAMYSQKSVDGIVTNVAHVTKTPTTPILKQLSEELNTSYDQIKSLNDNLEEL